MCTGVTARSFGSEAPRIIMPAIYPALAWHNFQEPMDPERQINKGGADESKVDLELRLGLKPPD